MTTKSDMTKEQLLEYYNKKKESERKWGKRYRIRQKLLKQKLEGLNISVSDDEVDEEMLKE